MDIIWIGVVTWLLLQLFGTQPARTVILVVALVLAFGGFIWIGTGHPCYGCVGGASIGAHASVR
jgi:hypothetical protein